MVVKVYISGISGNKEVKKRQQRVLMILDSRNVKYQVIDIAEPGKETDKDFMQNNSTSLGATVCDTNPRHPLPPQIFNDELYCGDYDQFDLSNEIDEIEKFLKLAPDDSAVLSTSNAEIKLDNGDTSEKEKRSNGEIENVGDAVVGSTTNENDEPDAPTENGAHQDEPESSEGAADSSNAVGIDEGEDA